MIQAILDFFTPEKEPLSVIDLFKDFELEVPGEYHEIIVNRTVHGELELRYTVCITSPHTVGMIKINRSVILGDHTLTQHLHDEVIRGLLKVSNKHRLGVSSPHQPR
jgi:hypothetical protein